MGIWSQNFQTSSNSNSIEYELSPPLLKIPLDKKNCWDSDLYSFLDSIFYWDAWKNLSPENMFFQNTEISKFGPSNNF